MVQITRRAALAAPAILPFLRVGRASAATPTKIRFTLDWKFQGVHSWFFLARDKGYFHEENLDVTIDQGEGSAATITRIMTGAYDAGFGDFNAIVQEAVNKPGLAPIMVYELYNRGPYSLMVKADGPIKTIKDLEGRTVGAPAGSATARLFAILQRQNGIDPAKVGSLNVSPSLQEQLLVRGQIDGLLGYNLTSYANFLQMKLDPDKDIRWFSFADAGLNLYSNGVMVSQALAKEKPDAVRGLVRAINRGIKDAVADIDGAVKASLAVEPLLNAVTEKQRIEYTLKNVMITPQTLADGFGGMDPGQLDRSIKAVVEGYGLPRTPAASEVFDPAYLPPLADRQVKLPA